MFGFLRDLLAKPAPVLAPDECAPAPRPVRSPPSAPHPPAPPGRNGHDHHDNGTSIRLPLDAILDGLALELQPRVRRKEARGQTVSIPLEMILPQLSSGIVRIPFGTLRQAAPHLFSQEFDGDTVQVTLPLGEILGRLNPAFILRRRPQKRLEVPQEVTNPFGSEGQGVTISTAQPTLNIPPPPPPPPPPPRATVLPAASAPAASAAPFILSLAVVAEGWPQALRWEILQMDLADSNLALPVGIVEQALRQGRVAFSWKTLRSWIKPVPAPTASAQDDTIVELPLQIIAPLFLASQGETRQSRRKVTTSEAIPDLFFASPRTEPPSDPTLPPATLPQHPFPPAALPQHPFPPAALPSAAPPGQPRPWTTGAGRPSAAEVQPSPARGSRLAPKYATPDEIVSRAAALDDVAGVLIGLPDGLLVASRLAPDLNADTLAAFLPEIFGKVSQCTRELRMGELNHLNFTVGDIAWELFRANGIFFAAFGRPGHPLPSSQLGALAGELDHKRK